MENCRENASILREGLEKTGRFNILSKEVGVPLLAISLKDSSKHTVFEISEALRRFGWIVPAYTMPPDAEHIAVLRVVIREDFSRGLAERLVTNIEQILKELDTLPSRVVTKEALVTATDGKPKKTVKETQEEVVRIWKKFVDGRRVGAC